MSNAYEVPRGQTETCIAQIWSEVLDVRHIGRQDDFFELGGHSVLAMGMLSRLRAELDVDVSLTELFRRSQLAAFAEAVTTAQATVPAAAREFHEIHAIPLSPAQERIWLMEQIAPDDAAYNLHWALRLRGRLVPAALDQALREVQQRHDVLRAVFAETVTGPVQSFSPYVGGDVERFDLSGLEPGRREAELAQLAREHARTPFDLKSGPPLRVYLIKLGAEEWALLVNMHHLVGDGWSLDQFFKDVSVHYSALIQGVRGIQQPLAMQYGEFALAAHKSLDEHRLQSEVDYWRDRLRPPLRVQQLVTDFPRPSTPSYRGGTVTHVFPNGTLAALQALSRAAGVTIFVTLVSALQVLLHRRNGFEDVVLGTDIANRGRPGTEAAIGLFVNQLVLRTSLSGSLSFRELLQRTREVVIEALEYQQLPFDHLVRELMPVREVGGNPLFQVMVILHSAVARSVQLPGLHTEPIHVAVETSPFDLSVAFSQTDELRIDCRYRCDLFHDATIQSLVAELGALFQSAIGNPDCCIDELEVIPDSEQEGQKLAAQRLRAAKLDKLLAIRPRRIDASVGSLVVTQHLVAGRTLPLMVAPAVTGLTLERFAGIHTGWIEQQLGLYGALLFRGFQVDSSERLQSLTDVLSSGAMDYTERSSPRTRLYRNVFTSTDYPADQSIVLHNEQSYTVNWPTKLFFSCLQPADEGGGTPLADSRRVLTRICEHTLTRFERAGILYVRNFIPGLGVSWREAFQTDDRDTVDAHCAAAEIELEWRGKDGLQTRQRRPAVRCHPVTGERVWFNHAFFFNVASLERPLRESLSGSHVLWDDLPFQTYFGDGEPIPEEMLQEIRQALEAETIVFPWQAGDLLQIDNMLVAHGREPYRGRRQVAVTMAEPYRSVLEREARRRLQA